MGIATAVTGGLSVGMGIYNTIQGAKQANDAKDALNAYERQKLENVAEGLQVSTLGSDLQREEQSRLASSQVGALRESGTRGLIGGLGRVEAGNQRLNQQIGADLDMQQKQIDQMRAEDEARIRAMQENREIQDVSALSSQYNAGQQTQASGISQAIQGTSMIGNAFSSPEAVERQTTEGINSTSAGMANLSNTGSTISAPMLHSQPQYNSQRYNPMTYVQNQNPFAIPNPPQVTKI